MYRAIGIHVYAVDTSTDEQPYMPNSFVISICAHESNISEQFGPHLSDADKLTITALLCHNGDYQPELIGASKNILWNALELMRILPRFQVSTVFEVQNIDKTFRVYRFYDDTPEHRAESLQYADCFSRLRKSAFLQPLQAPRQFLARYQI